MKARIRSLLLLGLGLPLALPAQEMIEFSSVEKLDIPALQERLKVAKPQERLLEIKELGLKIPSLRHLSLDDADALATALSNPELGKNDGGKLLKSYASLGSQRDWVSLHTPYGPLAPPPGNGGITVTPDDFSRLMETIRKMGETIKTQKEKIAELEAKLKEKEK